MAFSGARLRELRRAKGYSQEDLAELARVSSRTVRSSEAGERVPRGYIQRALARALGCSLEDFEAPHAAGGAPAPVQNQLPVPPSRFVGRERDLEALNAAMRQGGRVVIEGVSGVGKTALASVFAWNASAQYPDGMLFVDLQGRSERLPTEQAMRHVVWSLRGTPVATETALELHAVYRALLCQKRVLLVLDNAADAAQIAPLIPPPPSALIVTTQTSLASLDLTPVVLEPLARAASIDLLRSCGCAAVDARRLSAVCGDLPLVLTVVAREVARKDCDVDELLLDLQIEGSRLPALDAMAPGRFSTPLQRGIAALAPELRRAVALLQVFPQELDRASAAEVWNVQPRRAAALLRELSERHLVQHCAGRGQDARYRVHDLVRLAAARQASASDVGEAALRHARHYLQLLDARGPAAADDVAAVSARVHGEAANLFAALNWCTRRAPDCTETAQLLARVHRAWALDLVLGPQREVLPCAPDSPGRAWMPQLCLKLGDLCRADGDYATAIRALERALRDGSELGNPHLELLAGILLGVTYVQQGEMDRALAATLPHARRACRRGDALWESFALMTLGYVFYGSDVRKAEALFRASLAAGERHENASMRAEAKCGLAGCVGRRGDLRRGVALAGEALDEVRKVGPKDISALRELGALTTLALLCLEGSDLEAATRYADQALHRTEAGAPGHLRVRALYVRGAVALASPSWQDAEPFLSAALEIDASLQAYAHRGAARGTAARFLMRARRLEEAAELLESLLIPEPVGRIGARGDCQVRLNLAGLLAELGRARAAREQVVHADERISRFGLHVHRDLVAQARALHERLDAAQVSA